MERRSLVIAAVDTYAVGMTLLVIDLATSECSGDRGAYGDVVDSVTVIGAVALWPTTAYALKLPLGKRVALGLLATLGALFVVVVLAFGFAASCF